MSETLIIKNFGPIKEMSFEFKKINILIGDQGTGKSTVAKVIAAITSMADGDSTTLGAIKTLSRNDYGTIIHFLSHLKVYNIDQYLHTDTFIHYQNEKLDFLCKNHKTILKNGNSQISSYQGDMYDVTFIPADRAAVNLFTNEVLLSFNELEADLPPYFIRFARLFSRFKKRTPEFDFSNLLGIKYQYKNERDIIVLPNGKEIDIKEASSALQTNISLLVIVSYFEKYAERVANMNTELSILIIEEPELNCFPTLQNKLIKYIIYCLANSDKKFPQRTLITTHSPYILTSLNNLMYAYEVGQTNKVEANKIIDKKYWVNPTGVGAYRLLIDGTCEDIVSENLIKAEKIDEVSGFLNEQFDKLLNIEFVQK